MKEGFQQFKELVGKIQYPALVLHGDLDAIVSYQDSIDLFKNISSKDKQLKLYGNAYHEILNEYLKDEVVLDITKWVKERI